MLLDDLVSVIETLQQRITTHRQSLQQNETRTRTALIDPLLTALGWDVSDPALVTPEYNVGNGRADYALNGSEAIPAAIVEAKRLGHALSDEERMQMLNYANARGVRHAAVTDGNLWEFYVVFTQTPQPLEDRRLLNLRISSEPAHEIALKMLLLWRPNLSSGQAIPAEVPILSAHSTTVSPSEQSQQTSPPATVGAATPGVGWSAMSKFVAKTGDPSPTAMRFSGGVEHPLTSWRQIVQHTVAWLSSQGLLTDQHVPIPSSNQRYIVNLEPSHPNGKAFHTKLAVPGTPFLIEANISSKAAISNTKKLLQHCGVNPDDVWLKVEP